LRVDEYCQGEAHSFKGLELPDEHNPLTHTLKQGNILRYSQAQLGPEELVQVLAKTFPGAWMLAPLRVSQMTWGMLHCIQKDDWQDWQEEVASAIADKLAIAVQQSLLYEQVQAANYQLRELALIDSLTQVPNRRYFDDYLHQEWRRTLRESTSLSLILCDVDFFKPYNDTYGHQKGDETLRAIAKALKNTVQRPGDVVARYGGEEFGIILPATTSIGAARISEEIQRSVSYLAIPHEPSEVSQYVTLSLGIASIQPQQPLSPEQIVEHADRALYQAKRQGRNQFCIYPNSPQ
jgi:diguanylate cyclase (GGDEF)-like protein